MDGGLRCLWSARPNSTAYYPIPVRRAATLLYAAFRRHVTMTPLRFANPSPPSSWIRDFHPQVGKHAWQTEKTATQSVAAIVIWLWTLDPRLLAAKLRPAAAELAL